MYIIVVLIYLLKAGVHSAPRLFFERQGVELKSTPERTVFWSHQSNQSIQILANQISENIFDRYERAAEWKPAFIGN